MRSDYCDQCGVRIASPAGGTPQVYQDLQGNVYCHRCRTIDALPVAREIKTPRAQERHATTVLTARPQRGPQRYSTTSLRLGAIARGHAAPPSSGFPVRTFAIVGACLSIGMIIYALQLPNKMTNRAVAPPGAASPARPKAGRPGSAQDTAPGYTVLPVRPVPPRRDSGVSPGYPPVTHTPTPVRWAFTDPSSLDDFELLGKNGSMAIARHRLHIGTDTASWMGALKVKKPCGKNAAIWVRITDIEPRRDDFFVGILLCWNGRMDEAMKALSVIGGQKGSRISYHGPDVPDPVQGRVLRQLKSDKTLKEVLAGGIRVGFQDNQLVVGGGRVKVPIPYPMDADQVHVGMIYKNTEVAIQSISVIPDPAFASRPPSHRHVLQHQTSMGML